MHFGCCGSLVKTFVKNIGFFFASENLYLCRWEVLAKIKFFIDVFLKKKNLKKNVSIKKIN